MKTLVYSVIMLVILAMAGCNNQKASDYPIQPVPFTQVTITDPFWADRLEKNREITIPIAFSKSEETGRIDNFKVAGGLLPNEGFLSSFRFDDSDVFKIIEGASYSLSTFPDAELEAYLDSLISYIAAAQEEDGYLYTIRTIMGDSVLQADGGSGKERWTETHLHSHELYNVGHMYEAAVAHYQATGKRTLLDVALKNADLVCSVFGPEKLVSYPGHQEIEIGLVKLYRVTGEKKYLDMAKFFLDARGTREPKDMYNQSHKPVIEQDHAVGHSVRAVYMYTAMADIAALTGEPSYVDAIDQLWEDINQTKLYITGGIGAAGGHEGFGGEYELPNMRAYCETCAGVANIFWNHRLFLTKGDAKYIDILERTLYNNVLAGVSLEGDHFFYPNRLESMGQHERQEWFGCACCPSNISRFIPSVPGYIYATTDKDLFVNLYISSEADMQVGDNPVHLIQKTGLPWAGDFALDVQPERAERFSINIRIPSWTGKQPLTSDLYRFSDPTNLEISFQLNGKEIQPKLVDGYAVFTRTWERDDIIEARFPLETRKIYAHDSIEDDRGKVALQRGPIVYAAEWPDYEDPHIFNLLLPAEVMPAPHKQPELLNGIVTLQADARATRYTDTDGNIEQYDRRFHAIPYYAWAHRGPGQMMVWIPEDPKVTRPKPAPTLASTSQIEASRETPMLPGIADQILPENSADKSNMVYHWWPKKGDTEWVIYRFKEPSMVQESSTYWLVDYPNGGCAVPASWKLYYQKNGKWLPVSTTAGYPNRADQLNTVRFEPVTTQAIKLEVVLSDTISSGLHEWIVK